MLNALTNNLGRLKTVVHEESFYLQTPCIGNVRVNRCILTDPQSLNKSADMTTKVQQPNTRPTHAHRRAQSAVTTPSTAARGIQHPLLASNSARQGVFDFTKQLRAESTKALPLLPDDHPYAHLPLTERNDNGGLTKSSPRKRAQQLDQVVERPSALHKRGKSTISLKGLAAQVVGKENDKGQEEDKDVATGKPKKSKSSTNLASLLSRPRSFGRGATKGSVQSRDKENVTPPGSAITAPPTPIWAQFATTKPLEYTESTTKVPLNDGVNQYNQPISYDTYGVPLSKCTSSHDDDRPALKPRPKSTYGGYASTTKFAFAEAVAGLRKPSLGRKQPDSAHDEASKGKQSHDSPKKVQQPAAKSVEKSLAIDTKAIQAGKAGKEAEGSKTPSRVKAAVAAWDDKSKKPKPASKDVALDSEAIEMEFESLLVHQLCNGH